MNARKKWPSQPDLAAEWRGIPEWDEKKVGGLSPLTLIRIWRDYPEQLVKAMEGEFGARWARRFYLLGTPDPAKLPNEKSWYAEKEDGEVERDLRGKAVLKLLK